MGQSEDRFNCYHALFAPVGVDSRDAIGERTMKVRRGFNNARALGPLVALAVLVATPIGAQTIIDCPTALENCTAHDLLVSYDAEAYFGNSNGSCTSENDDVDVQVTFLMIATPGGGSKFDIGMYAGTTAGVFDQCQVELLEASDGATNLDDPSDVCFDIDGDDVATHVFGILTVPCTPAEKIPGSEATLSLISLATSWANNQNQIGGGEGTCTIENVDDGTTAKCDSELVDTEIRVPFCGDGITDDNGDLSEQCDDGNQANGDGCDASCLIEPPMCGDGNLDEGEECDDGNQVDGDGCQGNCMNPFCGDNILDSGEACDDGNTQDGDGCRSDCTIEACGDGILDPGEQCDDGDLVGGDGCDANCMTEICGDGDIDPGEQCDDGGTVGGDGCSATCQTEVPTLGEWGLILMVLILTAIGVLVVRRQRLRI